MIKLFKLSYPGWEKEFETIDDARKELYAHICALCRSGEEYSEAKVIDETSSINDMLCTSCGCEFDFEVTDD